MWHEVLALSPEPSLTVGLPPGDFGIVQLAARWTLTPKMKVRILLPEPGRARMKDEGGRMKES